MNGQTKKIEDYLHLYLGCELVLRPLSSMTEEEMKYACHQIFDFGATEYHNQGGVIWFRKAYTDERLRIGCDFEQYNTVHYWQGFTPEENKTSPPLYQVIEFINWARLRGFDMDGLIESWLAISQIVEEDHL